MSVPKKKRRVRTHFLSQEQFHLKLIVRVNCRHTMIVAADFPGYGAQASRYLTYQFQTAGASEREGDKINVRKRQDAQSKQCAESVERMVDVDIRKGGGKRRG